ncbi:pseudouridine synthase [Aquabacter sp. L1I39]|uniref:pseudouridine synthase n=1 Tax=Aquabacter sp. L1I39 TaxID=2820278 RepID=UPI001ADD0DB7|nr:pseudouridine synthase [Aquabacter sp. L1I39]QTL05378.1 pseudouridine synthase [Aquabacter sp. L1I39]
MPRTQPPRKDKNRVPRVKTALPPAQTKDAERVAKVIARAGLGSRREIEDWILEGRVAVNGTVLTTPAFTVTAEDAITVDGAPLPERERTRLFLYHKPRGVVTTNKDPEGRTTLFEILPKGLPRLVSVGRLDLNSEGLLLLTNDGGLARVLELPETGWLRRYRVRAKGEIDQAQLDGLIKGITVEGVEYGPIEATLDRVQGANAWITVALREGKNREVRNVLGALGLLVNRLIRVSYGPFQLGEVPEGGIEEVRTRILRDQMGAEIIAASGADFDGPILDQPVEPPARRVRTEAAEDAGEERRPTRRGPPRRAEPEPEPRGRARRPRGAAEETTAFRVRSRRGEEERELESRGTVSDRKGREIKVERVVKPREEPRRGKSADGRPPRKGGQRGLDDARGEKPRFGRGRPGFSRDEGEFGGRPARGGARPPRRDERPRSEGDDVGFLPRGPRAGAERGERPARPFRERSERPESGARPPRAGGRFGGDREERGERPARPFRERSERSEGGARPPRAGGRFGGDREERGERPARPFRERSERPEGGARPPRSGGRFGGDREERGERPARPFRERSERPEGGERPQRSGGFRSGGRDDGPKGFKGGAGKRPSYGEDRPRGPAGPGKGGPKGGPKGRPSGGFKAGPKGGGKGGPKGGPGGSGPRGRSSSPRSRG